MTLAKNSDYVEKLEAYAFPRVIEVISRIKDPSAFHAVKESELAKLRMTLAIELSIIVELVLYDKSRVWATAHKRSEILDRVGGAQLKTLRSRHQSDAKALNAAINDIIDFQRHYYNEGSVVIQAAAPSNGFGWAPDLLVWLEPHPLYVREEVLRLDRCYRELTDAYALRERTFSETEREFNAALSAYEATAEYKRLLTEHPWSGVEFTFDDLQKHHLDGAAFVLRATDPSWWNSFCMKMAAAVAKDASRARLGIALRDWKVVAKISNIQSTKFTWDVAAAEYFKTQENPWGVGKAVTADLVRVTRSRLRRSDLQAAKWIERFGDRKHPLNLYNQTPDACGDGFMELNQLLRCLVGKHIGSFIPDYVTSDKCSSSETAAGIEKWWRSSVV